MQPFEITPGICVQEQIGEGASSAVYRAIATRALPYARAGDPLALKLFRSLPEERVAREISIGKRLNSPFCTKYFDSGVLNGPLENRPFAVMEWVDGMTLPAFISKTLFRNNLERRHHCRRVLFDVLSGLADMHAADLLHRDLQPKNIMVTASGRAKLIDFGGAADQTEDSNTAPWEEIGTRRYWPPERVRRAIHDPVSNTVKPGHVIESDVFMLASCLVHAYTGNYLFSEAGTYPDFYRELSDFGTGTYGWPEELNEIVAWRSPILFGVLARMLASHFPCRLQTAELLALLQGKFSYIRCVPRRDSFPFSWLAWIFKEDEQRAVLQRLLRYVSGLPPRTPISPSQMHAEIGGGSLKHVSIEVIERLLSLGVLTISRTDRPIFHYSPEDFDFDEKYMWNDELRLSCNPVLSMIIQWQRRLSVFWRQHDKVRSQRFDYKAQLGSNNGPFGDQLAYYAFDGRRFLLKKAHNDAHEYWLAVANGWIRNEIIEGVVWSPVARDFDPLGRY